MPTVVMVYIFTLIAIHIIRFLLLPEFWDHWLLVQASFIPSRYSHDMIDPFQVKIGIFHYLSWVSYSLFHHGNVHIIMNCIYLAVFGSFVAHRINSFFFVILSIVSAVGGAFLYLILNWGSSIPVIGVSGVVFGFMGAMIAYLIMGRKGPPVSGSTEISLWKTILLFAVFSFLFDMALESEFLASRFLGDTNFSTAWETHLGGMLAGFGFAMLEHWVTSLRNDQSAWN